ncbi:MAG: NADPH dehydrogenase NamA [Oscillospiraceae bacterium]|nr:NADPH dehydrogenase NamA [Oscillospiraceae bacterium]
MSKLFSPYSIKNLTLKNRIVMAPMCMNMADKLGNAKDFHVIHYATRAIGGVGLIITEATAVESCGRITSFDLGIWNDYQIDGLKRITKSIKRYGSVAGIQLAHAGRKCEAAEESQIFAPSPIAYDDTYRIPVEMTDSDMNRIITSFSNATYRAKICGFDFIEIHAAHGYLINQFLSPLTNKRNDEFNGPIENRAKFLILIIKAVRDLWDGPLGIRISAEDFLEEGNHPDDLAVVCKLAKENGVDIINVSSGGVVSISPKVYPGYQLKYAELIKKEANVPVIAGGLLTEVLHMEEILSNDRADLIFLGRELLRNPYFPQYAANKLGENIDWHIAYERGRIR